MVFPQRSESLLALLRENERVSSRPTAERGWRYSHIAPDDSTAEGTLGTEC